MQQFDTLANWRTNVPVQLPLRERIEIFQNERRKQSDMPLFQREQDLANSLERQQHMALLAMPPMQNQSDHKVVKDHAPRFYGKRKTATVTNSSNTQMAVEGTYPRTRYEIVNTKTNELIISATKRKRIDTKVEKWSKEHEYADFKDLCFYELEQTESEGPWVYSIVAEGRYILRECKVMAMDEFDKGNGVEDGWLTEDIRTYMRSHDLTEDQLAMCFGWY